MDKNINTINKHRALCRFAFIICHECMELFDNRKQMIQHQIQVHGLELHDISARASPSNARKECQKQAKTKRISDKRHTPITPLICDHNGCHKVFISLKRFNEHKQCHSKPFKCVFCAKRFGKKWNLKMHHKIHDKHRIIRHVKGKTHDTAPRMKRFRCKKCLKEFARKDSLQKHWQTHEMRDKRNLFMCKACDATFTFKSNQLKHQKLFHCV
eukprot:60267_1